MNEITEAIPQSEWRWYGMAAHFICGHDCLFHMATEVGGHMISTVGDYRPYGKDGKRGKRTEIGDDRMYETFVFTTKDSRCGCGCGAPEIDLHEIDAKAANDPKSACETHMEMCAKYAARPVTKGEAE